MIPEVLQVMVPQKFIDRAPPDYQGFKKHVENVLKEQVRHTDIARKKKLEKEAKRLQKKGIVPTKNTELAEYLANKEKEEAEKAEKDKKGGGKGKAIGKIDVNKPLSFSFVPKGTLGSTTGTEQPEDMDT